MRNSLSGALGLVLALATSARASTPCQIAKDGQALMPVVVSAQASAEEKRVAEELAAMLGRISGGHFEVQTGDGSSGIVVGTAHEFPGAPPTLDTPNDLDHRDDFVLLTSPKSLRILGASEDGARNGVWGVLRRLGFRQYFPGPLWEHVPTMRDITVDYDLTEHPAYALRRLFFGFGTTQYNDGAFKDWLERNRMTMRPINAPDSWLKEGDGYSAFVRRHQAVFDAHPEWTGVDAKGRKSTKLRFSSLELRALLVQDALDQLQAHPDWHSISLTPSDGGGWIDEPTERGLGTYSDRVVGLANEVAAAVRAKFPGKVIALSAYDVYSAPPAQLPVDKDIIVGVATRFIHGGYEFEDLLRAWREKATRLSVRDYYSVWGWDHDLPGQADASNPAAIAHSIASDFGLGARAMDAEAGDSWGPDGLGFYVAAQTLWDVNEVDLVRAETEEFLADCFGSAKAEMAKFYALIDGKNNPLPSDELVDQMNAILAAAQKANRDPGVRARINSLIEYTRYIHAYLDYASLRTPAERAAAAPGLKEFLYKMRGSEMVHVLGIIRLLEAGVFDAEEVKRFQAPITDQFSDAELDGFVRERLSRASSATDEERTFSHSLVSAPVNIESARDLPGKIDYMRGKYILYTQGVVGQPIQLSVSGGLLSSDYGPVKIDLIAADGGRAVDHADVVPDKQVHEVTLHPNASGIFIIIVNDHKAGMRVSWPEREPMSFLADRTSQLNLAGRYNLYFYVPPGSREVIGYSAGLGDVVDASGAKVYSFTDRPEIFHISVPPGQDGRLWKFSNCLSEKILLNVPPYLARSVRELLVPAEALAGR